MTGPIAIRDLFYREAGRAYHVQPHSQPLHQWYVCVHGSVATRLDGKPIELAPGQSVLYRPGVVREPRTRGQAPGYFVAVFENHGLDLDPICDRVLDLPLALRDDLNALIAEIVHPQAPDSPHLTAALLVRLLIGQRRAAHGAPAALNAKAVADIVAHAEAFMRGHLHEPLDRAAIARAANCSVPHLTRLFRSATGGTVLGRLLAMRLAHARVLLRESEDSIGGVAIACGFASFSHFARSFRAANGMAPSAYRRTGGALWKE